MHYFGASGNGPEFFRNCLQLANCDHTKERGDFESLHPKLSPLQLVLF